MSKCVVLFDDERSFKPGFRDNAIVARTVGEAVSLFESLRGKVIDELWLDYNLSPGDTTEALHSLKDVRVREVFFHSSAYAAKSLVEYHLTKAGVTTPVEISDRRMFVSA